MRRMSKEGWLQRLLASSIRVRTCRRGAHTRATTEVRLLRLWKPSVALVTKFFADRVLIGSDNLYDAPGVTLRDLPRVADVLNFVRQLPAGVQTKIANENLRRLYRALNT